MIQLSKIIFSEAASVSYTAIVLTSESREQLRQALEPHIRIMETAGWEIVLHHVTLNMGPYKGDRTILGQTVTLSTTRYLEDNQVAAIGVKLPSGITSKNEYPHITVAVNRAAGGKPMMSNKLPWNTELGETISLEIEGTVEEVPQS